MRNKNDNKILFFAPFILQKVKKWKNDLSRT